MKLFSRDSHGRVRIGILFICTSLLAIGVTTSILTYMSLVETEKVKHDEFLSRMFQSVHSNLQQEVDRNLNALHALKANYVAHGGMTREEFINYGGYYTSSIKSIQALEWVPVIPAHKRDSFERATRLEGFTNFQIFETLGVDSVRAGDRELYLPIHYIEPLKGNEAAFGYDPGPHSPVRTDVIHRAISTRSAAASDVINLIQTSSEKKAILVFVPIFYHDLDKNGDPPQESMMEGVYLIDQLVSTALSDLNLTENVSIQIIENKIDSSSLIYGDPIEVMEVLALKQGKIRIADRTWDLVVGSTDLNLVASFSPGTYLVILLFLTMITVTLVFKQLTDNRKQLRLTARDLKVKNRELEQFAYAASHDLREPLRTLSSLIDVFQQEYREMVDERGHKFLHHINQTSRRMNALILDLLNYSRIEAQEAPVHVDCNVLLQTVREDISQLLKETSAEIDWNDLPAIYGYPSGVKLLFQNLLTNAIKFQEQGNKPVVSIAAEQHEGKWIFEVKDNGIGIPEEQYLIIFDMFKRLHHRRDYEGTGMGLTMCRKIIEMHNGRIWIDSNSGKGSSFYFYFDLH